MTQKDYYIVSGQSRKGPYDLMMLVRKVRNGSLAAASLLQADGAEAMPAQSYPELAEFFDDKKDDHKEHSEHSRTKSRRLMPLLQGGWRFLQRNMSSTIFSGLIILVSILLVAIANMMLPPGIRLVAYVVVFVFSHFLISCYLFCMLRITRGQPIDIPYFKTKVLPLSRQLMVASVAACMPSLVGMLLFTSATLAAWEFAAAGLLILAIPGIYTLALYSFTPLLILDQNYELWEALATCRRTVHKSGGDTIGVLFALYAINFIGGLCVFLPMAITLPITMSAIAEIYDDMFSS